MFLLRVMIQEIISVARSRLLLVTAERPVPEGGVEQRQAQRDEVVPAPHVAASCARDDSRRGEGSDRAPDAVAAVHGAEHGGAVAQVGAEDVVHGEVDGVPEAQQEVGAADDGEGGGGHEGREPARDAHLREAEGPRPPQPDPDHLHEGRRGYESQGVADEDQGHDRISDVVVAGYRYGARE